MREEWARSGRYLRAGGGSVDYDGGGAGGLEDNAVFARNFGRSFPR